MGINYLAMGTIEKFRDRAHIMNAPGKICISLNSRLTDAR